MKKILLALLLFGFVNQALASTEIRLADPDSFTSPYADAPGHRLYHMYRNDGYHFETLSRHVNKWVYFDANYEETKLVERVGFDFRVEHKDNRIRKGYVFVYSNGKYVGRSEINFTKSQDCPEIRPSNRDEGLNSLCGSGNSGTDAEAVFAGGISGDKFRVWLIGEKDAGLLHKLVSL